MTLKKIVRDRKRNNIHFQFKSEHSRELTEYVIDEFALEEILRNIVYYHWSIEKRINGRPISSSSLPTAVIKVRARAKRVFRSEESAERWLREPHPALAGRIPMDMLWSEDGAEEVINVLGRIEHGVIS